MHEATLSLPRASRRALRLPLDMPARVALTIALLVLLLGIAFGYGLSGAEGYNAPQLLARLKTPSFGFAASDHWLGTDQIGRDILLRCLKGTQISVGISLAGVIGGCVIGSTLGLVCGYFGGWIDRVGMVLVDIQLALPNLLLILTGIALFGSNIVVLIALISLARWEGYARLARGMVLKTREQEFVEAARAIGAGAPRILLVHILPNIASPLFVMVTLSLPSVMLLEASLSFIGIGVQPPTPSLGRMVADGRDFLATHPWIALAPAALIAFITIAGQVIADWCRAKLDVKAMT